MFRALAGTVSNCVAVVVFAEVGGGDDDYMNSFCLCIYKYVLVPVGRNVEGTCVDVWDVCLKYRQHGPR